MYVRTMPSIFKKKTNIRLGLLRLYFKASLYFYSIDNIFFFFVTSCQLPFFLQLRLLKEANFVCFNVFRNTFFYFYSVVQAMYVVREPIFGFQNKIPTEKPECAMTAHVAEKKIALSFFFLFAILNNVKSLFIWYHLKQSVTIERVFLELSSYK